MLNSYANTNLKNINNFNYNINAVSGTIRKSHPKSIITKVKLDDTLLDKINPKYTVTTKKYSEDYRNSYNDSQDYPVVILQVMLCGDNYCLVEFVLDKDFQVNENE